MADQTFAERVAVSEIRPGGSVRTVLRVLEKRVNKTRAGKTYLALKLGDRSGTLPARLWEEADYYADLFEGGDYVFVQGLAETYQSVLQLRVQHLERVAPDAVEAVDFERTSRFDVDEMLEGLRDLIQAEVGSADVKRFLLAVLDDEAIRTGLRRAPAAKGNHHAYVAGLLEHTLSMCRLAVAICDHYADYYPTMLDVDLVISGAVLHDIGKIWELAVSFGIDYTTEGRLVGHIVMGAELVSRKLLEAGVDDPELGLRLKHLVLSHHGQIEYGAPVLPQTPEAQLLHYIDQIDARMNMFAAVIEDGEGEWSPFNRALGRFVFRGQDGVPAATPSPPAPIAKPSSSKGARAPRPTPTPPPQAKVAQGNDEPPPPEDDFASLYEPAEAEPNPAYLDTAPVGNALPIPEKAATTPPREEPEPLELVRPTPADIPRAVEVTPETAPRDEDAEAEAPPVDRLTLDLFS